MNAARSEIALNVLARLNAISTELHITDLRPIAEGEQNFVFACSLHGERSVLKVTDSRHRRRGALKTQLVMLHVLKHHAANVSASLPIAGNGHIFETAVEGAPFYIVAYPYAAGESVRITEHGYRMGQALAELHSSMRQLPRYDFDEIGTGDNLAKVREAARTLRVSEQVYAAVSEGHRSGDVQLLHGDFNAANLKIDGSTVTIFDFDNCVYGSPAYELANSLYMVLFDEIRQGSADLARYRNFRQDFLQGYHSVSRKPFYEAIVDAFISYRVLLLSSWLQKPDDAPLFIRQSSPSWLDTLQTFVQVYFGSVQSELKHSR